MLIKSTDVYDLFEFMELKQSLETRHKEQRTSGHSLFIDIVNPDTGEVKEVILEYFLHGLDEKA